MARQDTANNSLMSLFMNIVIVVLFASLMAWLISLYVRNEPDVHGIILEGFAHQFEQSAAIAHWRWQASGKPERIMLLHFDRDGKEIGRSAVRMAHFGWPWVHQSRKGCEQLWNSILDQPAMARGFKIIADYFPARNTEDPDVMGYCRYRLSAGPHFDYYINNGDVIYSP